MTQFAMGAISGAGKAAHRIQHLSCVCQEQSLDRQTGIVATYNPGTNKAEPGAPQGKLPH